VLVREAEHEARWVRVCAIHALGEMKADEARAVARAHLTDAAWSVRGAAAIALASVGNRSDLPRLLRLLDDPHAWPRRGATYALGRLRLVSSAARVRAELSDPSPDVRLAAIWALGELGDEAAREPLARLLSGANPARDPSEPVAPIRGDAQLGTDAESRLFDAAVQALQRLAHGAPDTIVDTALRAARGRLSEAELDRHALLPLFEPQGGRSPTTVRDLFEGTAAGAPRRKDS